jgi:hypothetical protein
VPLAPSLSAICAGTSLLLSRAALQVWSIPRPYLYTLVTTLKVGASVLDNSTVNIGLREVAFTPDEGLFLNEQPVKARGFCNHNSFTGVGVGVPDRLNLLRVQAMRGVGGNSWRMSHNPPSPRLLELTDRLGVTVLDENRNFDDTPQDLQVSVSERSLFDVDGSRLLILLYSHPVMSGHGGSRHAGPQPPECHLLVFL